MKKPNEVYLLNFNEFDNKIIQEGIFTHEKEIYNLSACPYDPNKFITSYATGTGEYAASLYDMSILTDDIIQADDEDEEGTSPTHSPNPQFLLIPISRQIQA